MPHKYILRRSKRRTLTLKIENGKLVVYAPLFMPDEAIDKFVNDHQKWINNHLNSERINVCFDLRNDDYIYLLGHRYKLKVVTNVKDSVTIVDDTLVISGKDIKSIYHSYSYYLAGIIGNYIKEIKRKLKIDFIVQYKGYKSRWGCCYPKKNLIIMNLYCACLPAEVIKQVICHEITHFKVYNHQKEFYQELEKICPDYKKQVEQLKKYTLRG